mmetsp:Transcript_10705/g.29548  ORF Transcript_10705/g.29548 Transcript_10705/m.29548 type:complete len:205 (+) Transcript_10705:126-740(+)
MDMMPFNALSHLMLLLLLLCEYKSRLVTLSSDREYMHNNRTYHAHLCHTYVFADRSSLIFSTNSMSISLTSLAFACWMIPVNAGRKKMDGIPSSCSQASFVKVTSGSMRLASYMMASYLGPLFCGISRKNGVCKRANQNLRPPRNPNVIGRRGMILPPSSSRLPFHCCCNKMLSSRRIMCSDGPRLGSGSNAAATLRSSSHVHS